MFMCVYLCVDVLVGMWFCVFLGMWFRVNFIVNQKHEEHGHYIRVLRVIQ